MKTASRQTVAKPDGTREAEAAKTMRLRALRLAKEAADLLTKEAADRDAKQSAAAKRGKFKLGSRVHGSTPPERSDEVS